METNGRKLSINMEKKEILFLNPVFVHNIWGGDKLRKIYGYDVEGDDVGECWGISAHENGDCVVRKGSYAGKTLSQLWKEEHHLFGNAKGVRFPLLIKLIDAKNDLSIQVHPDDAYAKERENGSFGKTECWYILDCPEDATLVVGHNAKDKAELAGMLHEGRWSEFIREIPVKKGDFIRIDPGTVHAIKGGFVILETQQNSDITYRVYDYDRLCDGKPRSLHIEQSIDVITVPAKSAKDSVMDASGLGKNEFAELISCDYYRVYKLDLDGTLSFTQDKPFFAMSVFEGDGTVDGQAVKKGDHFILPYGYGEVRLQGKMQLIASTVPEK